MSITLAFPRTQQRVKPVFTMAQAEALIRYFRRPNELTESDHQEMKTAVDKIVRARNIQTEIADTFGKEA